MTNPLNVTLYTLALRAMLADFDYEEQDFTEMVDDLVEQLHKRPDADKVYPENVRTAFDAYSAGKATLFDFLLLNELLFVREAVVIEKQDNEEVKAQLLKIAEEQDRREEPENLYAGMLGHIQLDLKQRGIEEPELLFIRALDAMSKKRGYDSDQCMFLMCQLTMPNIDVCTFCHAAALFKDVISTLSHRKSH